MILGDSVVRAIIDLIGDDAKREGLLDTPQRVMKTWQKLFSGYGQNASEVLKTFTEGACDEMVILKAIEFYSTCEHHFLPFFGQVSIGYIPDGRIVGISKLARVVEIFSRRLQVQERMTSQIADAVDAELRPKGVMVIARAQHLCMMARGVEKQNSVMVTSAIRGSFRQSEAARNEFLSLLHEGGTG